MDGQRLYPIFGYFLNVMIYVVMASRYAVLFEVLFLSQSRFAREPTLSTNARDLKKTVAASGIKIDKSLLAVKILKIQT
jgi:hypothetical protein